MYFLNPFNQSRNFLFYLDPWYLPFVWWGGSRKSKKLGARMVVVKHNKSLYSNPSTFYQISYAFWAIKIVLGDHSAYRNSAVISHVKAAQHPASSILPPQRNVFKAHVNAFREVPALYYSNIAFTCNYICCWPPPIL